MSVTFWGEFLSSENAWLTLGEDIPHAELVVFPGAGGGGCLIGVFLIKSTPLPLSSVPLQEQLLKHSWERKEC